MKRIAILGASGHGKVVAEIAELQGWSDIHFFDDSWPGKTEIGPWPVVGDTESLLASADGYEGVFVAIGNNAIRLAKQTMLETSGMSLATLIHPTAVISRYSTIEAGTVLMANAVVNPFSYIGKACIINTAATIDHDCHLDAGVHISPGANLAGGVTVGECSWIGAGSAVRQLVQIGADVIVGAGAAVVSNIDSISTFVGVPAKSLK